MLLAIAYLVLAIRQNTWCWAAAFASTAIYLVLMYRALLYMEAALQLFYLAMAVYGWYSWRHGPGPDRALPVTVWGWRQHVLAGTAVAILTLSSGALLAAYSDAVLPYVDSFTTWGAVITTWMVARKILENWLYWLVIDSASIYLYVSRELYLTSLLFAAYLVLATIGFLAWRREFRRQCSGAGRRMTPEQALASIGNLVVGARVTLRLADGPTSDSYLVERDAERWVLRIDKPAAAAMGMDRGAEAHVLGHVAGLGPELRYVDVDAGVQLTRYIEGRAWTAVDLESSYNVCRLAELLRRLHAIDVAARPLSLHEKVAGYAASAGTCAAREDAAAISDMLDRLDTGAIRLCHNDLVAGNIVDGDWLRLIDWEYAALGDPFFDLAIVVRHHDLSNASVRMLLGMYLGKLTDADLQRLYGWCDLYQRLVSLWQVALPDSGNS